MYYPSLKEFLKLSQQGNVIPVYKEINADLDTPVSAYLKIKKGDFAFLLESVEGQEKIARYSFLGANPSLVFKAKGENIQILFPHTGKIERFVTETTPLDEIKRIMQRFKSVSVPGLPRFYGGLVGYIGYDSMRFFERIPDKNPDDLGLPDCLLILTDTLLIFDHVNHTIKIVANVILPETKKRVSTTQKTQIYFRSIKKIESIQEDFYKPLNKKLAFGQDFQPVSVVGKVLHTFPYHKKEEEKLKKDGKNIKISSNLTENKFKDIVKKAKYYIKRGDIIQVVLSVRLNITIDKEPFSIYRNLRSLNPSPYMYFLKLKDVVLIGSSPEMLVRCEEGTIQTRPIAGTRPRGKTEEEDKKLAVELLNDNKEKAEHLMLVDLGRNDLGRVSEPGKVAVNEFMNIERYSHVMHLVSEVRGRLDEKKYDIYDVLKAAFPAGTVTGSPKIRAMEIIDELENIRRGPYAGCVGYFSFSHNLDTCITIRTIIVHNGVAYIQAGAGIVADSNPKKEYLESMNKARALVEAIKR